MRYEMKNSDILDILFRFRFLGCFQNPGVLRHRDAAKTENPKTPNGVFGSKNSPSHPRSLPGLQGTDSLIIITLHQQPPLQQFLVAKACRLVLRSDDAASSCSEVGTKVQSDSE